MPVERRQRKQEPEQELLAQMRQSLGLLQVAFDSASDAMVILDHEHTIRWANQTAADRFSLGLTAALISQPFASRITLLTPYGNAKAVDSSTLFLNQNGGNKRFRVTGVEPIDDLKMPLNIMSWKTITSTNETFYLVSFRDLDPIEQALEQQRLFVQQLAHELRTPLALLSGSLGRLSRLVSAPSLAINALRTAQSENQRLKSLVDNLMLLSDLETGRFPWSIHKQSLKAAVEQWFNHLPHHQQHLINTTTEQNIEDTHLDSNALHVVLDQLLANSLRFSDNTVSITIIIKQSNKEINLFFIDTGLGFSESPDDKIESIFKRFYRLEQHRSTSRPEGCGLGLTVARELVQGMGANIETSLPNETSECSNQGACIVIHFPRQVVPANQGLNP